MSATEEGELINVPTARTAPIKFPTVRTAIGGVSDVMRAPGKYSPQGVGMRDRDGGRTGASGPRAHPWEGAGGCGLTPIKT